MNNHAARAAITGAHEAQLEDYLNINGPYRTARDAAARLGVTVRTIERYKATLRERGQLPPVTRPPVERPGCTGPGWCGCGCGRRTSRVRRTGRWQRYVCGHSHLTVQHTTQADQETAA